MKLTVLYRDRSVSVDGVTYQCAFDPEEGLHALQWDGKSGWLEFRDHPNEALNADDPRIETFHEIWKKEDRKAKTKAKAEKKRKDEEAAEDARLRAEHEAALKRIEELKPVTDALERLASSDHEVIKAMERKLVAGGELEPAFVEARETDRAFVRKERPKT